MTSEIRANTLKNRVGLGTVSFTNTGPVVSGIVTIANSTVEGVTLEDNAGVGGSLKITTPSGYVSIGAGNAAFVHLNTDRGSYYFQKRIIVDEGIIGSYDENLTLQSPLNTNRVTINKDTGLVSIVNDLDVDGHTNLDNVSIAGVTTFASNINVTGNIFTTKYIYHTNDTDTYLDFGTNTINLSAGGNIGLTILDASVRVTDKLGINGATPQTPLDVIANGSGYAINVRGRSADNIGEVRFTSNDYGTLYGQIVTGPTYLNLKTGGVERLQLDGSETTFNSTGADTDFRVRTPAQTHMFYVNAGTNQVSIKTGSPASGAELTVQGRTHTDTQFTIGSNSTLDAGVQATIYKPATNTLAFATAGANERLRIDSNGKLVMGHTDALTKFHGPYSTNKRNPQVQINGTTVNTASISITSWDNNVVGYYGPALYLAKSGSSTIGTNSRVSNQNSILGSIIFSGDDGDEFVKGAMIQGAVDGGVTTGNNDMPGRLMFLTTADGAQEPTERLRIASDGIIQFRDNQGTYTNTVQSYTSEAGYITHYTARTTYGSADLYRRMLDIASIGGAPHGSSIRFLTSNNDNNINGVERMRIMDDGGVYIGTKTHTQRYSHAEAPALLTVQNGARVYPGSGEFAAPKGGFCDHARYELEQKLISISNSNLNIVQARNGQPTTINDARSGWSFYSNLPNYLLGHAATDNINNSNFTLTLYANMTVFLLRTNGWNAVNLSGWNLIESNTNIAPASADTRLYVKSMAAGTYTNFDNDSAMYFFVL